MCTCSQLVDECASHRFCVWVFGCLGVWVFGCLSVWVFASLGPFSFTVPIEQEPIIVWYVPHSSVSPCLDADGHDRRPKSTRILFLASLQEFLAPQAVERKHPAKSS